MGKRLEVSLFGTFYSVSGLHLGRAAVKAAIKAYGPAKWNNLVRDIALGHNAKRKMAEVAHTLGHPIRELYHARGIAMHDSRFGIEAFYGGAHVPLTMVAAKNRTLQPQDLMKDFKLKDMLAVFWTKRESAILFRWDDVEFRSQKDVTLVFDGLGPLLARSGTFDLALDVVWQGAHGKRRTLGVDQEFTHLEHVFHIAG